MTESTWSLLKNVCGRCSGTAERHGLGLLTPIWTVREYKTNADRAIKAYFKYNPMMGLYKAFPDLFLEQCRQMSYYSNLGLFWEVMAPVFFEMSDIYDEGGFKGVPDAMNFLVNGIFAIAGRPIYHHVYIRGECCDHPEIKGFMWLYEAATLCGSCFYRTSPFRGTKSYNAQAKQVPDDQKTFTTEFSMLMYSQWVQLAFRPHC